MSQAISTTPEEIIDADTARDARLKLKKDSLFVTAIKESRGKKKAAVAVASSSGEKPSSAPPVKKLDDLVNLIQSQNPI